MNWAFIHCWWSVISIQFYFAHVCDINGCIAAPKIWNTLLPHLKNSSVSHEQFKSGLKTWLFVQAYS